MQDKEIDQLFRSGLDNLEVEPSGKVWGEIRSGLDAKKPGWKTYLSIAASLLILLSAGLYFISQTKEDIKKPEQITAVKIDKPAQAVTEPVIALQDIVQPQPEKVVAVNTAVKSRKQKTKSITRNEVLPVKQEDILQPATQMAQTIQKPADDVKYVVPDKQTPLNEKPTAADDVPLQANALAVQPAADIKTIAAAPAKKHRIRNLGDLINAVVSKVDKRKDKLIEFSDTKDEDESVVSGLNLGFIKIKKQER
ncbi:hypothetical protein EWM62_08515 [Mucilaginibacter terrigena]|uniref:Uncharacterized protein n=2 Tax=Mucilaginibacter terrigena TaxID=2492395 RepID=A0A4Q5LN51_9SPHI|nr:hypothetical protein EWM62_08515 [Mucilaginibacter terrigena]